MNLEASFLVLDCIMLAIVVPLGLHCHFSLLPCICASCTGLDRRLEEDR